MIGDIGIELIDTAGLEPKINDELDNNIREKTLEVIKVSDLIFFVIDARAGVTPNDEYFANQLRREKVKKVVLANKCEGNKGHHGYYLQNNEKIVQRHCFRSTTKSFTYEFN